ncbi:MAG: CoA transferase [Chloroflexi bacterium]|nr:CoA transferase [Chloroflexota bacterium]
MNLESSIRGCLEGIKIIELADLVAAPYCARLLADLGAQVIKVERPGEGDVARGREPFLKDIPHPERSGLFLYVNAGKYGITLDVNIPSGGDIFRELVKQADILVEDRPPGELDNLGLGYAALSEINPALVMVSITPFGQTGTYRNYRAYPLNTFHSGGEGYLTPGGSPELDRPPVLVGRYAGEYECGISAAGAALVAFYHRLGRGLGQHVDISKQEALIPLNLQDIPMWANLGVVVNRATRGWRIAGVLPCKDGYVQFAPNRPEEWDTFIELLGSPEWAKGAEFKDPKYREEHAAEIKERLAPLLMQFTKEELYRRAQSKHCPVAPYHGCDEIVDSGQLRARGFFVEMDHPEAGRLEYPSVPYRFCEAPARFQRPAPLLGEHNEEIYRRMLGYTAERLARLRGSGVI